MSNERADIAERWVEVCRLLNAHGAEYLVIGRVGMGLHGFDYATRDLDILVPRDRDNMTRVLNALSELPYGIARELDPATETRKMMTIVGDDPRVDVLKGSGQDELPEGRTESPTKIGGRRGDPVRRPGRHDWRYNRMLWIGA